MGLADIERLFDTGPMPIATHDLERLRRSISMLTPGTRSVPIYREEASEILSELIELRDQQRRRHPAGGGVAS
jgi:hypothetical protein